MHVRTGTFGSGQGDASWTLLTGSGHRVFRQFIDFNPNFTAKPVVTASITNLDAIQGHNLRINVEIKDITRDGCFIEISTWADTLIWSCKGYWLAMLP